VIWCNLGVMFLRFMNAVFRREKIKHLSKYWGGVATQDDPCRSNIGGRDPCGVDAYAYVS